MDHFDPLDLVFLVGEELTNAFQQAKDVNLARSTTHTLDLVRAPEVALIDLNLTEQRCCAFTLLGR